MLLGSGDLHSFIQEGGIEADLLHLPVETLTVEAAAEAMQVSPEQIVKSLLFVADGRPIVAIACGPTPIDRRAIAAHLGVGRKRVKLADAETVLRLSGYPVGAMPPFGHTQRFETLMDERLFANEVVFAGGGSMQALMRVAPAEIRRVTGAIKVDLQRQAGEAHTP